jgi:hypothetical protein
VPVAEAIAEHLSRLVHRGNVAINAGASTTRAPWWRPSSSATTWPASRWARWPTPPSSTSPDRRPNAYLDKLARGHDIPRRMRRLGERCESVTYVSRDPDVDGTLDDMRDMLRRRWEPGTGPRMFHTPALERFTREAIKAMVASDVAHVSSLQADGRRIAITNVFRVGDRFMSDSVSHDPDPELARFGLGQAELYEMLRTSVSPRAPGWSTCGRRLPLQAQVGQRRPRHPLAGDRGPGKLGELALNERRVAMSLRARRLRRWEKR